MPLCCVTVVLTHALKRDAFLWLACQTEAQVMHLCHIQRPHTGTESVINIGQKTAISDLGVATAALSKRATYAAPKCGT